MSAENLDTRVFVRADRTVDYGNVMRVMGRISSAGYTRIGLVSETEQEN
ncbi:MAG: biopolymer transporter ExbD [Pseudomonadota bacterium]